MGTNYYACLTDQELMVSADLLEERGMKGHEILREKAVTTLHIGKSSYGWCFALHVEPDEGINNLDDWKKIFAQSIIKDEYGKVITIAEMLVVITNRSFTPPPGSPRHPDFHRFNHSQPGPNGLTRATISEYNHCIGHGDGTYDLITGEFS